MATTAKMFSNVFQNFSFCKQNPLSLLQRVKLSLARFEDKTK